MEQMNNQNNTASKDRINFEYKLLKDANLQTVFEFYNWMHEETDEQLNENMFMRAWDTFNEMKSKTPSFNQEYIIEGGIKYCINKNEIIHRDPEMIKENKIKVTNTKNLVKEKNKYKR